MRKHVNKLIAILVFFIIVTEVNAQEAIPVTGGDISSNEGSISYTVGQIVYTSNSGVSGSSEEGVQQAYEIWVYAGIEETDGIQLECSVFPNPTTDILTLKIKLLKIDNLIYQLYEMNGKMIEIEKITTIETNISMKNLNSGTYFLKVSSNEKELKNFKIIKH